ncbi:MAG: hypothetical protein GWN30_00130, partial [Gammaproteobacteria bacterium]|nr:hypothetical protein [Gammaproteobacteria bacterium]
MDTTGQPKPNAVNRMLLITLIVILFAAALGIRIFDLDDPPLDFHSTRQLRSLIIARGMFYQGLEDSPRLEREIAVNQWKDLAIIEPPLFERLVALTYRIVGAEIPWIARIYSIIFWLAGGIPLFLLARRMTSDA